MTQYCLAGPSRWPNGITVAPDGSVWFGEQSVPGVGHLFSNGTVVEYPWPSANTSAGGINGYRTGIWGVAFWNGMVWATDADGNALVGLNPANGAVTSLNLTVPNAFPYTLTAGPDGALWFTTISRAPYIGRVAPDLTLSLYPVLTNPKQVALEIQFASPSLAYYVALDPFNETRTGVYAFDPANVTAGIWGVQVGADTTLYQLNSLSLSKGTIWVTQHSASNLAGYDLATRTWTFYPTSTKGYTPTTLPYFVRSSGTTVWFNEHYSNVIARLDPAAGTLTEYSEANPPISDLRDIQNVLTIAESGGGLWFTSTTGNYIGFVDGNYKPSFAISTSGKNSTSLAPGGAASVQLQVSGTWSKTLQVQVSDSENYTSVPSLISIQPDKSSIPAGSGPSTLSVAITAKPELQPGKYTLAVTVTDGLVSQTAYVFLTVT